MQTRDQSTSKVSLQTLEVAQGGRLVVNPDDNTLYSITKPDNQPLPRGVLAVQEQDRVILKYPDGTQVVIAK